MHRKENTILPRIPKVIAGNAIFRYTGQATLDVRGVFNRRAYHFSVSHPELSVSAEDAALLRGYPELVEVKGKG